MLSNNRLSSTHSRFMRDDPPTSLYMSSGCRCHNAHRPFIQNHSFAFLHFLNISNCTQIDEVFLNYFFWDSELPELSSISFRTHPFFPNLPHFPFYSVSSPFWVCRNRANRERICMEGQIALPFLCLCLG